MMTVQDVSLLITLDGHEHAVLADAPLERCVFILSKRRQYLTAVHHASLPSPDGSFAASSGRASS
jgi:hypothetical protein